MGKFLEQKSNEANQRFLNADGDFYANGGVNKFYAEGDDAKAISDPLIIICECTADATTTSGEVELFNASETAYSATPAITGGGSVIKTSGVPNVTYEKIIRGIAGGNTYLFDTLRIECLSAPTDAIKESAAGASISYEIKTAQGHITSKPIYPLISAIQQVKSIRDVKLGRTLVNADTSFKVKSINGQTKIMYYFYAVEQGTPSGSLLHGDSGKSFDVESLNRLDL